MVIISIANKDKGVNLALKEDTQFLKLMQFDHMNSNEDDSLILKEEFNALRLSTKKIESDKKARKYILDIN